TRTQVRRTGSGPSHAGPETPQRPRRSLCRRDDHRETALQRRTPTPTHLHHRRTRPLRTTHRRPTTQHRRSHHPAHWTCPAPPPAHPRLRHPLGPIPPNPIRKLACDADILPVLLGSDSRVLDIGRTTRIFPPPIRKAITPPHGGAAFPHCPP